MMDQSKRDKFAALHRAGEPLLLFNVWDAGSAIAVAESGAASIATGSHSLAGAQGFADAQSIPLPRLLDTVRQIVGAVECPVTIDFEGGYSGDPAQVANNAALLAETGAVGCNFEDQVVGGEGLHSPEDQSVRITACARSGLFVNARTDIFLKALLRGEDANQAELLDEALKRARAYADAGASSFFAPGLSDISLVARLCEEAPVPVNIMMMPGLKVTDLANAGVARISWGPAPWRDAMTRLREEAARLYSSV